MWAKKALAIYAKLRTGKCAPKGGLFKRRFEATRPLTDRPAVIHSKNGQRLNLHFYFAFFPSTLAGVVRGLQSGEKARERGRNTDFQIGLLFEPIAMGIKFAYQPCAEKYNEKNYLDGRRRKNKRGNLYELRNL